MSSEFRIQVKWIQPTCRSVNTGVGILFFFFPQFLELTRALLEGDAGAHLDVVDPDVTPGAVCEKALHHHLGEEQTGRRQNNRNGDKGRREDEKLIRHLRFFQCRASPSFAPLFFPLLFHERVNDVPVSSTSAPEAAHFQAPSEVEPGTPHPPLFLPGDVNASLSATANNDDG